MVQKGYMQNGWIKLHRKVLNNPIYRRDLNAWHVFETLMLLCDRNTGQWEGGRFQLAEWCNLNPNTIYSAIKRLEKAKMITLHSNNRFTTFSICNWSDYQGDDNTSSQQLDNNTATTGQHSNKNKELRIKKKTVPSARATGPGSDLYQLVDYVSTSQGAKPFPSKGRQYQAAKQIFDAGYTLEEAKRAVDLMRQDVYWASKIFDVGNLSRNIARYSKEQDQPVFIDIDKMREERERRPNG